MSMSDAEFNELMAAAAKRNQDRDQIERLSGFAAPADAGPLLWLRTIDVALEAGIRGADWDCVAEGLDMLRDLMERTVALTS